MMAAMPITLLLEWGAWLELRAEAERRAQGGGGRADGRVVARHWREQEALLRAVVAQREAARARRERGRAER